MVDGAAQLPGQPQHAWNPSGTGAAAALVSFPVFLLDARTSGAAAEGAAANHAKVVCLCAAVVVFY